MQSGSECCPQGRVPPCFSCLLPLLLQPLPIPNTPIPFGGRLTRSVGKAATTSSHLLTTSARFCYTKCAEVCSRMRLSIRHVAHQNVVVFCCCCFRHFSLFIFPLPTQLSVCFLFFWLVVWPFWATFINRNA